MLVFPSSRIHIKIGEIHELLVLALSLVWFAGATPDIRARTKGDHAITRLPRRVLRRFLKTSFEKVLRRVLRRCLAVGFRGRNGSEKGS